MNPFHRWQRKARKERDLEKEEIKVGEIEEKGRNKDKDGSRITGRECDIDYNEFIHFREHFTLYSYCYNLNIYFINLE